MNMRSLLVTAGALSTLTLAACTVSSTGTSGSGGTTSATTTTTTTTTSSASNAGGSGVGGSTGVGGENAGGSGVGGGTGGGGTCNHCADVITDNTLDPNTLCTDSGPIYDALAACTCTGNCAQDCGDSVCMSKSPSAACVTCLQDTQAGCGNELNNCNNDAG